ncbi:NADPH-dependent F420 reductase [Pimelobacter simplex]|uniref:NADPH-dependent F420 reductase n=1 Tax=Nocardioides simplex TaxID=2045 RepID=UPI00214FB15B|nr:NADPH-dependent F420 reductase [Pimelobacter simplex]UUW92279.1 NADPH-dependent F420 reductase [Pimelobacter simplex]UUW96106.1 NADPH-dependent F420 reductase [Pimelobacter simplex]
MTSENSSAETPRYTVAVIGGTGPQGKGLGYRFARHGHDIVLGSRAAEKAETVAAEVNERLTGLPGAGTARGAANADAIAAADVVLLAVPYEGHDDLVTSLAEALAGKTVISCVNPLAFDKRGAHGQVIDAGEGSAAESAARIAPEATVVGAFHNVAAPALWGAEDFLDEDVIVVGDSVEGKQVAIDLAASVTGRPGIDGGKLRLARVLEPFTAVLISINRKYKTHSGIRVTGLDAPH